MDVRAQRAANIKWVVNHAKKQSSALKNELEHGTIFRDGRLLEGSGMRDLLASMCQCIDFLTEALERQTQLSDHLWDIIDSRDAMDEIPAKYRQWIRDNRPSQES